MLAIIFKSGSHLLSHAVPSIVPSAARVLTFVFGMGTGVPPGRIATGILPLPLAAKQQYSPYSLPLERR